MASILFHIFLLNPRSDAYESTEVSHFIHNLHFSDIPLIPRNEFLMLSNSLLVAVRVYYFQKRSIKYEVQRVYMALTISFSFDLN